LIPIGDSPKTTLIPWVNYGLILANIVAFVYMLGLSGAWPVNPREQLNQIRSQAAGPCYGFEAPPTDRDRFFCEWSFQPKEFFDNLTGQLDVANPDRVQILLSVVTSLFLHGGWLHILGNMLFLWVFGDNVEDRLGHAGYLAFYLLGGIVATMVQGLADATSVVPVVGASGAVAAVLGAYIVYYPRATVNVVIPFFILIFIPIPVPAIVMIGLWFVQNLLGGFATVGATATPNEGIAWFAHIGGFLWGMATVWLFLRRIGRRPPRWGG
jgi:membrane associated rhomboid family serine protease